MDIVQNAPANTQHHRAVPPHQRRKGIFIALTTEALDQRSIRQVVNARGG